MATDVIETEELEQPSGMTDDAAPELEESSEGQPAEEDAAGAEAETETQTDPSEAEDFTDEDLDAPFSIQGEQVTLRQLLNERVTNQKELRDKWLQKTSALAEERRKVEAERLQLAPVMQEYQQFVNRLNTDPAQTFVDTLFAMAGQRRDLLPLAQFLDQAVQVAAQQGYYNPQQLQQQALQQQYQQAQQQYSSTHEQAQALGELNQFQYSLGRLLSEEERKGMSRAIDYIAMTEGRRPTFQEAYQRWQSAQLPNTSGVSNPPTMKPRIATVIKKTTAKKTGERVNGAPASSGDYPQESALELAKRLAAKQFA
jgi:hypothetical protein